MTYSFSIIRSSIAPKTLASSLKKSLLYSTYSSEAAQKFTTHLQENHFNVEKSLNTVKAKLDSPSITQVLKIIGTNKPQLGVRFFIWAGLQPSYRHTPYMYSKASQLLEIQKNPEIITDVIHEYRAENVLVCIKMFKAVLNLCRAANDAKLGLWVLKKMKEFYCRPDNVSYNMVIKLVVDKGELDEAMGLMQEMGLIDLYPDMVTYVTILKGLCDVGRLKDAFGLIKVMKGHNCIPNAVIYSTLLDGICRHGTMERAWELLGEMERENEQYKPNLVTYTTMIKGLVAKGRAIEAVNVLDRMSISNIRPNRVTIACLLDGLCKEGCVEDASKVIDKVSGGNICYEELYSLLVVSLFRSGKHEESEEMFRMMVARGMRPNGMASSGVIKRMILEGRTLEGFRLFDTLEKSGNLPVLDSDIYSILLDGLSEENCFVEASKLVDRMVERKILLRSPYDENIIKHLKVSGEYNLASKVARINSWSSDAHNMS